MSTHRHIDVICLIGTLFTLLLTVLFVNAEAFGVESVQADLGYENRLFDASAVHTIDIVMDDWESFLETCEQKEYETCALIIDGQTYQNVAIRAKGNNSLSSVAAYGNDRYSFKIEFDHYDSGQSYFGLDKLCLTSLIQDNTMLKDYLVYQIMADFGVDAPLCSYTYITINGEEWGLYLAVEGVEEGFLRRNYGSDYGELYKPDSASGQDMQNGGGQPGETSSEDIKLQYIDDDPDSYPNIFDQAKTDVTEADQRRLISSIQQLNEGTELESVLDIEEILRYFVVHNFVCNFDSYTGQIVHNYYLYEEDGVLSMIPWDYNLAFGSFQSNAGATELVNFPIDTPVSGGDLSDRPMVAWIFRDADYTERYHQYVSQFLSQYFENGVFMNLIDTTVALIAPYVERDPTKFCTYEEFETGVAVLKKFCLLRAESVSGQLEGTIPATSEGQRADQSALVDAGDLDVSATGSMSGAGMDNQGRQEPGGLRDLQGTPLSDEQPMDLPQRAEQPQTDGQEPPGAGERQTAPEGQMPGGEEENALAEQPLEEQSGGQPEGDWPPGGRMENGDGENWNPAEGNLRNSDSESDSVPALILSVAVLGLGLAFAALFRRR